MKRKLLSLLALLCLTVASAWADNFYLYLEVSGTSAILKYGDPGTNPYFKSGIWYIEGNPVFDGHYYLTTITVDESCRIFKESESDTGLTSLFNSWMKLTTINNIENLITSNVTSMYSMFTCCSALTTLDLSGCNTENVKNMEGMFSMCSNLETLNLSGWNTSSVLSMYGMFSCCSKLETIDVSGWNTSNVTNMNDMFFCCSALTTLDLSSWNTSSVTTMQNMFWDCSNLKTICVGNGWNTSAADGTTMFSGCTSLPNYNGGEVGKTHAHTGAGGYLSFKLTANEGKTGEYWATYYSNVTNYEASSQVFAVKLTGTTIAMNEISDRIVNQNQGVVLKSTSASIIMTPSNDASAGTYTGNSLTGTMSSISNPNYGSIYVLNKKEAGIGFYKLSSGGTIGANKAYLTYAGALAREFFLFDDDATSINEELGMKNEELYEGAIYNVAGQHIQKMQRGINIVNGKKIIK